MKRWIALLLVLLLPASALAVKEGVVEEAPAVDVSLSLAPDTSSLRAYLPDESYYAGADGMPAFSPSWGDSETYVEPALVDEIFEDGYQMPRLTDGEAARARKLLEQYQSGKAVGDGASVLNAAQNAVLGVYPLDPADYDGEEVYLLLPSSCLTDAQLLAIIDAYDQLGMTFDLAHLNARNCARGGGIEATRFFTAEENERRSRIFDQIQDGLLTETLLGEDALRSAQCIQLDARYYYGMGTFLFLPYRSMTDEEMAAQLFKMGFTARTQEETEKAKEFAKKARQFWTAFQAPLNAEVDVSTDGSYLPALFSQTGLVGYASEGRRAYVLSASYLTEDLVEIYYDAWFDAETGQCVSYGWMSNYSKQPQAQALGVSLSDDPEDFYVDLERTYTDEGYRGFAESYAYSAFGETGLKWFFGTEGSVSNWNCVTLCAQLSSGQWLVVQLDPASGRPHAAQVKENAAELFHVEETVVPLADMFDNG